MGGKCKGWSQSDLLSRRWWLCTIVCAGAIATDLAGRPLGYDSGGAIGAIAVALISTQTYLDRREPCRGHWSKARTLRRKWWTGISAIAALFAVAGYGLTLDSATVTLVSGVAGAWLGSQTYLDYRAGQAQNGGSDV